MEKELHAATHVLNVYIKILNKTHVLTPNPPSCIWYCFSKCTKYLTPIPFKKMSKNVEEEQQIPNTCEFSLSLQSSRPTNKKCSHTHLLGYEIQPAFQGIGNLYFTISIIDLNTTSSTKNRGNNNFYRFKKTDTYGAITLFPGGKLFWYVECLSTTRGQ